MRALVKTRNRIGDNVMKTLEISCIYMKIVERREPEKRTELLHNNFVVRSTLVDDLHGRLVIAVNNNSVHGFAQRWPHRLTARIMAKVSLWLICRQDHAG